MRGIRFLMPCLGGWSVWFRLSAPCRVDTRFFFGIVLRFRVQVLGFDVPLHETF